MCLRQRIRLHFAEDSDLLKRKECWCEREDEKIANLNYLSEEEPDNGTTDIRYNLQTNIPDIRGLWCFESVNIPKKSNPPLLFIVIIYRTGWTNPLKVITYPTIKFIFPFKWFRILNMSWIFHTSCRELTDGVFSFLSPLCKNLSH